METVVALVLFTAAIAAPLVSRKTLGDYGSPPAVVIGLWCGTIGLLLLRLLPYRPLTWRTWAVLALTVIALAGGSLLSLCCGKRSWRPTAPLERPAAWVIAFGLLGIAGAAWYAASVVVILGRNGFANAEALRYALFTKQVPSAYLFAQLFAVVTPLLWVALRAQGTRLPAAATVLAGACALSTLTTTDRTQFFSLVLGALFMVVHRLGPRLSWIRAAAVGLGAMLLLVCAFVAVESWRRAADRGLFLQLPGMTWVPGRGAVGPGSGGLLDVLGRAGQRLAIMYAYATGSYPALDRLLEHPQPPAYGVHTFFPLLRPWQRLGIVEVTLPSPIPEYVELYPPPAPGLIALTFNAYTFLYYPIRDFGIGGALVYATLLGLLAGFVYAWARADRADPLRLLVYSQVATALALAVMVNKFNNTAWWYVLVMSTVPWTSRAIARAWRARAGRPLP